MLAELVQMRDPLDGGRPLDMRTPLPLWRALERRHGALGSLFMRTQQGHVGLDFSIDFLHRALQAGGSLLTWDEVGERVHRLGLFEVSKLLMALFADIMAPSAEDTTQEGEGESAPLASGA